MSIQLKRLTKLILAMSLFFSVFCIFSSASIAEKTRSLEYSGTKEFWLNEGNSIYFNGKKDGKWLNGKLYLTDFTKGSVRFDFYRYPDGKLVLTHNKVVTCNPKGLDWFGYNFNLDRDGIKGYLLVKVTTNPSTWGTLIY